jgi:hypothetical protein
MWSHLTPSPLKGHRGTSLRGTSESGLLQSGQLGLSGLACFRTEGSYGYLAHKKHPTSVEGLGFTGVPRAEETYNPPP